ncbi:hypothetical protein FQA39_LY06714 [Lamprigera yunnana]|nr:hypothetical protein FQA39_LY06714 [Lamprigera yunnana]
MSVDKFGQLPQTSVHTNKNHIENLILRLNRLESSVNDDINAIIGFIPTATKSKIDAVFKPMFNENPHLTRFTSMEAAFCHILNRVAEIESTAAITAHIFSILAAKFSEDNLFKPEVIVYMRLLIDQMLEKTKKVEYGSKKTEQEMRTGLVVMVRGKQEKKEREDENKFGRLYKYMQRVSTASGSSLRGPPGLGFKLTPENDYDMDNRRLTNVMDPANSSDVLNLKYYLSSKNNCGGGYLLEVCILSSETDGTNKAYVDSTIRDSEMIMRTYKDILTRDGETA